MEKYNGKTIKMMSIKNQGFPDEHLYIEFDTEECLEVYNDRHYLSLHIKEYKLTNMDNITNFNEYKLKKKQKQESY